MTTRWVVIGTHQDYEKSVAVGTFQSYHKAIVKGSEPLEEKGWVTEIVQLSDLDDIDYI